MAQEQMSLMAFEAIKPEQSALQSLVYASLRTYGAQTDTELESTTGLKGSTLRPRRIELLNSQWITIAGYKIQNNGRKATLWKAL